MDVEKLIQVDIPVDNVILKGDLCIPSTTDAMIVFAHGSGSSRLSKRNKMVARLLQEDGFGTLLFDLLTALEDANYYNRFDIPLMTRRLIGVTQWLETQNRVNNCSIGFFGASTGAAAALEAAAYLPEVTAVVSRGGRPDLAATNALESVKCPTLLIVGSLDREVLKLNKEAFGQLKCEKETRTIVGATHLFEEPGKMEEVASVACSWFKKHLILNVQNH